MHSSRIRIDRALTAFLCCLYTGVCGGVVLCPTPPCNTPPCEQTDACENITFPALLHNAVGRDGEIVKIQNCLYAQIPASGSDQ